MKPTKSTMTVLKQVVELISVYLVPKLARKHGPDNKSRSFSPWSRVVSQVHAQLAHSLSLNDVCDDLRNHSGALWTVRGTTPTSRNGRGRRTTWHAKLWDGTRHHPDPYCVTQLSA